MNKKVNLFIDQDIPGPGNLIYIINLQECTILNQYLTNFKKNNKKK